MSLAVFARNSEGLLGLAHRLVHVDVGELLVGDLDEADARLLLPPGVAGRLARVGRAGRGILVSASSALPQLVLDFLLDGRDPSEPFSHFFEASA